MKKIAVISCVNDRVKYDQMRLSLEDLEFSKKYHFDFFPIVDAKSMGEGYNRGLTQSFSDHDYFIYVHQDVVFIDSEWLTKSVKLMDSGSLDLVGVVGVSKMPESWVFWEGQCHGAVYENRGGGMALLNFGYPNDDHQEVDMVDGLIMMTNKRIDWPNMPTFHFYDVLMCLKYRKKGLKVGVPNHSGMSICHNIGDRPFDSTAYLTARDVAKNIGNWL